MDDPTLDAKEHRRALRGLRRVNFVCQTSSYIANEIVRVAQAREVASINVLDLGCGSGDIATEVSQRVNRHVPCHMTGWDISPTAITYAKELQSKKDASKSPVLFEQVDVFEQRSQTFDIIYCCLFLHHFSESQSVALLARMRELATLAVIVDDLRRTRRGLWLAKLGCYLLSRSPVVHFDGPQSVRAAFTCEEALELAAQASMNDCSIRMHWPERYLLRWDAKR